MKTTRNSIGGISKGHLPNITSRVGYKNHCAFADLKGNNAKIYKALIEFNKPIDGLSLSNSSGVNYHFMGEYSKKLTLKGKMYRLKRKGKNPNNQAADLFVSDLYLKANPNMEELHNDPRKQNCSGSQGSIFDLNKE